jgi:hypothetical protein
LKDVNEFWSHGLQFRPVRHRQFSQKQIAPGSQHYQNPPPVRGIVLTAHKAAPAKAVNKFNRAVMAKVQPFGETTNSWMRIRRQAFDRQQKLMLLLAESFIPCGAFAEMDKSANLISELSESLVVGRVQVV